MKLKCSILTLVLVVIVVFEAINFKLFRVENVINMVYKTIDSNPVKIDTKYVMLKRRQHLKEACEKIGWCLSFFILLTLSKELQINDYITNTV